MKRICVIGAGPSGIFSLKALQESSEKYDIVCYDSQKQIGGLWYWEGENYFTEEGHPVHSPMYEDLKLNGPKETIEFTDYQFPSSIETSFPGRSVVLKYLEEYVEKFGLHKYINLNKRVDHVSFLKNDNIFKVVISDINTSTSFSKEFDYVIVCSGHYCKPYQPIYPGEDTFPGEIMHSKHFRSASRFVGLRMLIVGAALSAKDIVFLCKKNGAKSTTITSRKPINTNLPTGIIKKPIFTKIEGSKVFFEDGTSDNFDAIIYCTGYLHSLEFLEEELRFHSHDRLAIPLYLGTVFPENSNLFFVGMSSQIYTFTMFYHQAKLISCMLEGKFKIPSPREMKQSIAEWQEKEKDLKGQEDYMHFQTAYLKDLIDITNSDERYLVLSHFLRLNEVRTKKFETYTEHKFEKVF